MERQHTFDDLIGGGAGMEVWRCTRCGREAFPAVWGGFWPSLARYVPFTRRWRCKEDQVMLDRCELPPAGWVCTRDAGHRGPCAAWDETGSAFSFTERNFGPPVINASDPDELAGIVMWAIDANHGRPTSDVAREVVRELVAFDQQRRENRVESKSWLALCPDNSAYWSGHARLAENGNVVSQGLILAAYKENKETG